MSATRTRGMTAIAVLNVILGAVATLGSAAMIATGMGLLPGSPPPYNQSPPGGVVAFGCARLVVSLLLIASGIGVAATEGDEAQSWLVGVGASTGVFLVGAALVVVDQGM